MLKIYNYSIESMESMMYLQAYIMYIIRHIDHLNIITYTLRLILGVFSLHDCRLICMGS